MNWHQLTGLGQLKSFARYRFQPIEANCIYSSVNLLLFAKGMSSEVSPLPTAVMNSQVSRSRMLNYGAPTQIRVSFAESFGTF